MVNAIPVLPLRLMLPEIPPSSTRPHSDEVRVCSGACDTGLDTRGNEVSVTRRSRMGIGKQLESSVKQDCTRRLVGLAAPIDGRSLDYAFPLSPVATRSCASKYPSLGLTRNTR